MIYIDRSAVVIPRLLTNMSQEFKTEKKMVLDFFGNKKNRKNLESGTALFRIYRNKAVKDALAKLFAGKCAYCESKKYFAYSDTHVEHFRPKGEVIKLDGTRLKPGYYWLGYDWTNLVPSCGVCNCRRRRKQADNTMVVAGKGNYFPIQNDRRRSLRPGAEKRETPLLIDVCNEEPSEYIRFRYEDGQVVPASNRNGIRKLKGETSIRFFGLNRALLVQDRVDLLMRIQSQMDVVAERLEELENNPNDSALQLHAGEAIRELENFKDPREEFSGMVCQVLEELEFLEGIELELKRIFRGKVRKPRGKSFSQFLKQKDNRSRPTPALDLAARRIR